MNLLTGGSGLLASELKKYITYHAPSHNVMDITNPSTFPDDKYNLIIHCAAYTDVVKAETERDKCFETNVMGTINLLKAYPDAKFLYISSEYAHNPVNYYSETKRAGELAVQAYAKEYIIVRTLFKPRPFPYEKAFFNQFTQGDYVDMIAPLIVHLIIKGEYDNTIKYVGTGRKTMLELAMKTKPLIPACSVYEVMSVKLPTDYQ